jgi:DNA ligase (NAD+)
MPPKRDNVKTSEILSEKFLKHIAKTYKTDLVDAALRMDTCIHITARRYNLEYNEVYKILFEEEMLAESLKTEKACDKLTVEECIKSNGCFYLEPYGCLSRTIPDAAKINEDPDKYISINLKDLSSLKKMVEIAAYLYYNYDGGGLTDNSFDALEWNLKKKEKIKGRAYEKIGAMPVEKIRVDLTYPMPSLNKIKPGTTECTNFLAKFNNSSLKELCIWSLKLDGVSGELTYKKNILTKINTRGTGIVGGNVLYVKDFVKNIPLELKGNDNAILVVRGEFIISKKLWEKYKGSYSNARAFVSGKINSGFISAALNDIEFIAYEIVIYNTENTNIPSPVDSFKILKSLDFKIVDNGSVPNPTIFQIMELYTNERSTSEYYIDGLVLEMNKEHPPIKSYAKGGVLVNPEYKVAFKMILEEQIRSTKVINVVWNVTRYGKLFPKVIFEAVYIDGVRITKATAHSAAYIKKNNIGAGTKIEVFRSGDVIPQIKDPINDPSIKVILPDTSIKNYEWHWDGSNIVLDVIEGNREVLLRRSLHFFTTIGVPKLKEKTLEKMYDLAGLKTPENIVRATVADFSKIKGIGKKSAEFFYDKIREVMSTIPPDRFIEASTVFQSGMGRKSLKQLFKNIPNVMSMSSEELQNYFKKNKIPGFADKKIKTVVEGIPEFRKYLDSFAKTDVEKSINNYTKKLEYLKTHKNKLIAGKKFVLTGFMNVVDYEFEDYIYDNDGDLTKDVKSDVSAVIFGKAVEISKKMTTASKLGISVLSLQEFCERYEVPLKRYDFSITGETGETGENED